MNCIILQFKHIKKCKVKILQKLMEILKLNKAQLKHQEKVIPKKEDKFYIKMHNNH